VLARAKTIESKNARNVDLKTMTGVETYNTSPLTLHRILADPPQVAGNLRVWIARFDADTRDVIEKFDFDAQIGRLNLAKLLYLVLPKGAAGVDALRSSVPRSRRLFWKVRCRTAGSSLNAIPGLG
jgi:type I restriction enzyme M protein